MSAPEPSVFSNFVPSRKRDLAALLCTAASDSQPSGKALPRLFPDFDSIDEHVDAVRRADVPSFLLSQAVTPGLAAICSRLSHRPDTAIAAREAALTQLASAASRARDLTPQWLVNIPASSPARNLNLPLFQSLADATDFPDKDLVYDLRSGMPIAGAIPPAGTLRSKHTAAAESLEDWTTKVPLRNATIYDRIIKAQGSELSNIAYESTMAEVKKGWLAPPRPITPEILQNTPLTPRFAIREQHGDQAEKIRLIDDFKASGLNLTLDMSDTCIPDALDSAITICRQFGVESPGQQLNIFTVDFKHAYKNVAVASRDLKYTSIIVAPPRGPPVACTLLVQPFGSRRAPANWGRVTRFLQHVLERLFSIHVCVFVDDVYCIEPVTTVSSAFHCVKTLCFELGLLLAADKESPPGRPANLLGTRLILFSHHLLVGVTPKRLKRLTALLDFTLYRNSLTAAAASKVRGKLGFAQTMLFGRMGRAQLSSFADRQYDRSGRRFCSLNEPLREACQWWLAALPTLPIRQVPLAPVPPVSGYSDAAGFGHVGVICFTLSDAWSFEFHVPEWFTRVSPKIGIYELELVGAVAALCSMTTAYPGRPVQLMIDNQGAQGSLIRGSADSPFARAVVSFFWMVAAASKSSVWIEFVPSNRNAADAPSRCCSGTFVPHTYTSGPVRTAPIPALIRRFLRSEADLYKMALEVPSQCETEYSTWECFDHNFAPEKPAWKEE